MSRSCIILAGGKSLRMGHDKISENLGGMTLLELVVSRVEPLLDEILIVIAEDRSFPWLEGRSKIKKTSDIYPGKGSLGGIYTGLVRSSSFYNLVLGADMPFLNQALIQYLFDVAEGFDLALPKIGSYFEPLHAIYSKNCIGPAEYLIKKGRKVIIEMAESVSVRYVDVEEIDRFDPRRLSFFNINTKEDLELAKKIYREIKQPSMPS